jgi:hypothetical protein
MKHQTSNLTAYERGADAARRGLFVCANPYLTHTDYHARDWGRGHRSVTGEPERPPIVIAGFDDRIIHEPADDRDEDVFDDAAAISTLLRTAA